MTVEVTEADYATADDVIESVEWQMSNFVPAKGESSAACQTRRLRAAIAEAVCNTRLECIDAIYHIHP